MRTLLCILYMAIMMMGCGTTPKPKSTKVLATTSVSPKTMQVQLLPIPELTDEQLPSSCRFTGAIDLPAGGSYVQIIYGALVKEFMQRGMIQNATGAKKLAIKMQDLNFNTVTGKWKLVAKVHVQENLPYEILSETEFATSWVAEYACNNAEESFIQAAHDFAVKVANHASKCFK